MPRVALHLTQKLESDGGGKRWGMCFMCVSIGGKRGLWNDEKRPCHHMESISASNKTQDEGLCYGIQKDRALFSPLLLFFLLSSHYENTLNLQIRAVFCGTQIY